MKTETPSLTSLLQSQKNLFLMFL